VNAPLWLRKFVVDFVETGIALIFGLTLIFPSTSSEAQQIAVVVGGAVLSALVSAARRAIPGFIVWLNEKLGTSE
jgi:hypothetical protein